MKKLNEENYKNAWEYVGEKKRFYEESDATNHTNRKFVGDLQ